MTGLVNSCTYKSNLETVTLKELVIMPGLLLQKISLNSKLKKKLWNTEAKIIALEKRATGST